MEQIAFDPADPKAALPNCRTARRSLLSMARKPTPSPTSAARPTCARAWNGCCSPRPSIRAGCNWPGACGALSGGSPARSSSRCLSSLICSRSNTGQRPWSGCTCARRPLSASSAGNPYPRITVTHRPSQREADWAYGPFASRAAAERYADEALKLFLLRRCTDDLAPDPSHPGCVYSEMKMCLAPCYKGCTDERYGEEAAAVESFLATRGESRLVVLRTERDEASANLEFESAAALARAGAAG